MFSKDGDILELCKRVTEPAIYSQKEPCAMFLYFTIIMFINIMAFYFNQSALRLLNNTFVGDFPTRFFISKFSESTDSASDY